MLLYRYLTPSNGHISCCPCLTKLEHGWIWIIQMRQQHCSRCQHLQPCQSIEASWPIRLNYPSSWSRSKHPQTYFREPKDRKTNWVCSQLDLIRHWAPLNPRDRIQLPHHNQLRRILKDLQGACTTLRLTYNCHLIEQCSIESWGPSWFRFHQPVIKRHR